MNVDLPVWGLIDNNKILTSNPSIITVVNQRLKMCAVVSGHVDKSGANLTIQISINIEIFNQLFRIWIGARD